MFAAWVSYETSAGFPLGDRLGHGWGDFRALGTCCRRRPLARRKKGRWTGIPRRRRRQGGCLRRGECAPSPPRTSARHLPSPRRGRAPAATGEGLGSHGPCAQLFSVLFCKVCEEPVRNMHGNKYNQKYNRSAELRTTSRFCCKIHAMDIMGLNEKIHVSDAKHARARAHTLAHSLTHSLTTPER